MIYLVPLLLLIVVQALDLFVHVAVGELEPIRVMSNVIIVLGGVITLASFASRLLAAALAGFLYLLLNVLFLVDQGWIKPATGAPRIPLIVFVATSLLILCWLISRHKAARSNN
ncbi:MAG: hypothetical protein AAFX52_13825 [Pseudomonadota bacterium]